MIQIAPPPSVKSVPDAIDLDPRERRVAIAGDWHRNQVWVERLLPDLARQSPGVRTLLQLGDLKRPRFSAAPMRGLSDERWIWFGGC